MAISHHFHLFHAREEEKRSYLSSGGAKGMAVSIVFTSLATCFVLARVYTRAKLIKRMEANDWMVVIALILSFVFMSFYIIEALNGMGMHGADIPQPILLKQLKAFWITIPFYNAAVLCAKASILMQYFRLFPSRGMRHTCWIMIGILATYGSWAVLSAFLNCIPVAKFWDPRIPGYCLDMKGLWFSNASMHIATDLAILIIPIPALSALELPRQQKVALISIFALGGFVCITSICRLLALKKIADSSDPTFDNVGAASWSAIECNVGIICACLPTLRPLISRIVPHLLSSRTANPRSPHSRQTPTPMSPGYHPPTYWGSVRIGTISTTITTHIDDLEYGTCTGDADRFLALRHGYAHAHVHAAKAQAHTHTHPHTHPHTQNQNQNQAKNPDHGLGLGLGHGRHRVLRALVRDEAGGKRQESKNKNEVLVTTETRVDLSPASSAEGGGGFAENGS